MKRLTSFDIAKAIALIAVVIGHTSFIGVPQSIVDFCYAFDMPLFFFVSGYFCRRSPLTRKYVEKNAKALLIPYVITAVIVIVFMTARAAILHEAGIISTAASWFIAALYGAGGVYPGMPEGIIAIGAIWYLLALFWAKLLLSAARETKWPALICIVLFIVGVSTKDSIWLPFSIQPALCAVLFMYVGQIAREEGLFARGAIPWLLWVCMLMTWLYCGLFFGKLYMVSNTYAAGAIDVIGGLSGSFCVIKAVELVERRAPSISRFFAWMGRNTLPLFCMHLVELNVMRWDLLMGYCGSRGLPAVPIALMVHAVAMGLLTLALYLCPHPISGPFFVQKRSLR